MREYFDYPFNIGVLQRKKKSIKNELMQNSSITDVRIGILSGSTTSEIKDILELFLLNEGIKPTFYQSEYNKYYEDVMFKNEKLKSFNPNIIYIHTSEVNINNYPKISDDQEKVNQGIENEFTKFKSIWEKIRAEYNCVIIQNNFELPYHRSLGNLDFSDIHGKTNFIMALNQKFAEYAQLNKGFYINDINYLSSWFGLERWHDRTFWYSYKYACSYDAIPLLCHNISRIIKCIYGKSSKCLVVDLDNTLWGGVIGDDGLNNIQIGKETPLGEAYTELQSYIKELRNRGVMLAICSKNEMKNVIEGFSHPDNVLKLEDFIATKANWSQKDRNIQEIAENLNIGLDSLVFLDDNPIERELVKWQQPKVRVPDIGDDITKYISFLDREGYFEPATFSLDDIERNKFYEENLKRDDIKNSFKNYDEFLRSLNMKAEIACFKPVYYDRISQLVNKTNQFNLTTKRFTISEIEQLLKSDDYVTLYGRLSDKFGDNGLVSCIIGNINELEMDIVLWIMSCRVLKRGLELSMFDELVNVCKSRGIKRITGWYYKTLKNNMVEDFYKTIGFSNVMQLENGDSCWEFIIPEIYISEKRLMEVNK